MLLLWCSMLKIEGCSLIEFLFAKVSPQGKKKKKTTMSHLKKIHKTHLSLRRNPGDSHMEEAGILVEKFELN